MLYCCSKLRDYMVLKQQQIDIMNSYCSMRLKQPKSVNMIGEDTKEAIDKMLKNFETEKAKKVFRKWSKTMAFEFTDLGKTFYTNIDKGIPSELVEGEPEKANIKITTDAATWVGIMSGEISGMKAYTSKKLKVKGSMPDLLKLQKIMK